MLAMVVNDNACLLAKRGALKSIASKLAPTSYRRADTPVVSGAKTKPLPAYADRGFGI